ncbi:MAG: hypothetical protein AAB221_13255 [Bacteroidota bacterium]
MQALRHIPLIITTFLGLTFFTKCNSHTATDNAAQEAALKLANNIDDSSLNLLKQFCFGKRGNLEFWQRVSADSFLYSVSYKLLGDTTELTVHRPYNFKKDFTINFLFNTARFYEFRFLKLKDVIVKIVSVTNQAQDVTKDTSVSSKHLFPDSNPFETLSYLTNIKDKYSLIGTSYRGDIGDFIEFWLSPQFKLTYLPDTSNMNQKFKKYWLDDFTKGKIIKEHWSLQKVYER